MACWGSACPTAWEAIASGILQWDDRAQSRAGEGPSDRGKCPKNHFTRLITRILGECQFAIDRTKKQMGLVGHEKEQELLADLRRHLERWKRTVPPHRERPVFI